MQVEAMSKAKEGHFQVACARTFEGLFGEAPDAGVTHPNSYLVESLEIVNRANAAAAPPPSAGAEASGSGAAAATPMPDGSGAAHTPSTGAATPAQLPFMRTPISATPGTLPATPVLGAGNATAAQAGAGNTAGAQQRDGAGAEPMQVDADVDTQQGRAPADSPIAGLQMQ